MYTLKEIEKYTNGKIIKGSENTFIKKYSCSKNPKRGEYFYIPVVFKNINREVFIVDAVKKGAIGFMIDKNSEDYETIIKETEKVNLNLCIVEVENVNEAIHKLGIESRKRNKKKPVIAVTGSVGKTTLCSLIAKVLETEKKILHDFKDENNNAMVFISKDLLSFDDYEMAVLELGIASKGKMTILSQLVEPSIAVINSIGTAHLNKLESKEGILEEKLHIVDSLKDKKLLFVNGDDPYLAELQSTKDYKVIKYSSQEAKNIIEKNGNLKFKTNIYGKETQFNLNLYGQHHITNIILAIKIAEIYHIQYDHIVTAIKNFKPIDGRLKIIKNEERNLTLIDDSYSSSLEAAKLGLETANKMKSKRKIAVLGKMAALGEYSSELHEKLGRFFKNLDFNYLYLTGEYTKHLFKGALIAFEEKNIKRFKSKEELMVQLENNIEDGDLIYIKAAGTQKFDEIVNRFKKQYNLK